MSKTRQIELHRAYLLHSRPYRDSSVLLDFISEVYGHVSAIAYVGKGKKSNKKGLLQPFSCLEIELKGQSSLKTLSQVQQAEKSLPLKGHYLFSGFYINELLVRLLPENIPCELLFHLYQLSIRQLNQQENIEPILRRFEMSLLEELGVSLDFSVLDNENLEDEEQAIHSTDLSINEMDAYTNLYKANKASSKWQFIPEFGFVKAQIGVNYPQYDFTDLKKIAANELVEPHVLYTFKRLMRQVMQRYLGNKPLHSRKLFTNNYAK